MYLGSLNGTFVNGQRVADRHFRLSDGDEIRLGPVVLRYDARKTALCDDVKAQSYPLQNNDSGLVILTRRPLLSVVIPDATISAPHAALRFRDGNCILVDLNSLNGCFVNDKKTYRGSLAPGDTLRLGKSRFAVADIGEQPTEAVPRKHPAKFGQYRVLGRLGRGGMADIYRVQSDANGQMWAMKVPKPYLYLKDADFRKQFDYEAQLMTEDPLLRHESLVRGREVGWYTMEIDGRQEKCPYLIMDLVDGVSVRDILNSERQLTLAATAKIAIAVRNGLHHLHRVNRCHLDIKPSNILIDRRGVVYLTDYGSPFFLAKDYAAPEVLATKRANPEADQYSLGVVMFEMLTGARPSGKAQLQERVVEVESELALEPREATPLAMEARGKLEDVIRCCLRARPQDRFA